MLAWLGRRWEGTAVLRARLDLWAARRRLRRLERWLDALRRLDRIQAAERKRRA